MPIVTKEMEITEREDWRQEENILAKEGIIEGVKPWRRQEVEGLNFKVEILCGLGGVGRMCEKVRYNPALGRKEDTEWFHSRVTHLDGCPRRTIKMEAHLFSGSQIESLIKLSGVGSCGSAWRTLLLSLCWPLSYSTWEHFFCSS